MPIFAYTDRITQAAVKAGLQQTKSGAGKVIGVMVFIAVVITILFALYLDRWFGLSILDAM